jgi:Flp pilus assembly protein TadG
MYRLMLRAWSVTDAGAASRMPIAVDARTTRRSRGRGQALVEFALVIPIFMLLLFALLDFGRVVYAQQTIVQDAREGARAGLVAALDSPVTTSTYQKIRDAALKMAPGVTLANANITGATGGCASTVTDSISSGTCFFPDGVNCTDSTNPPRVVVKISVTVPLITPVISNLVGSSFTPTAQSITYLPC